MKTKVAVVVLIWFAAIFAAAHANIFTSLPGSPPGALGIAFGGPLLGFVIAFFGVRSFREAASDLSPVFLSALHGWRFVGLGFIAAYYRALLPPGFAWPAGLGDITVAAFAPFIAYRLARDPAFLQSTSFLAWNVFGVIDFLSAVGLGVAHQTAPAFFHANVATGLMQELPFALIPCFFVPLLGMTHVIMLHQAFVQRKTAPHSPPAPAWARG